MTTAELLDDVDLREAGRFLDFMAEGEPVTFQTFSETPEALLRKEAHNVARRAAGKKDADPLARILHGTLEDCSDELMRLHAQGAGVWWMVNFGDGQGRKEANVTGVRCVFNDLDGASLQPVLAAGVEPHAIVESSPGRWHTYWQVTGCAREQFEPVQKALAAKFNSDTSVSDLPRVLRVPGFLHRKGEPFVSRIETLEPFQPYALDELVQRLGLDLTPKKGPKIDPETGEIHDDKPGPHVFADAVQRLGRKLRKGDGRREMLKRYTASRSGRGLKADDIGTLIKGIAADYFDPADPFDEANIKEIVEHFVQKDKKKDEETPPPSDMLVQPFGDFIGARKPVSWAVQHMIQRGYIYSLTARWGHGKTAVTLPLAMHVACGATWAGFKVQQMRVLYLAGENPDDVRLRALQAAQVFGMDADVLSANLSFTTRSLNLTAEQQAAVLIERVAAEGIGLVIVDTGVAHSDMEEENSNAEMHALAVALRRLSEGLGGAAVICLMHPPKASTRDTLSTRGGGAFAGEIDGELLLWQDEATKQVELFHSSKLRGPGFASVFFDLERHEIEGMVDNFGDTVSTVVAVPAAVPSGPRVLRETPAQRKALETLMLACRNHLVRDTDGRMKGAHVEDWRATFYSQSTADNPHAKKVAFQRARSSLQSAGLVSVEDDFYLPTDAGRLAVLAVTAGRPTTPAGA